MRAKGFLKNKCLRPFLKQRVKRVRARQTRWRYLQDLVLLGLVDLPCQAAVGDGVVDDGLVGLGAGLLEQLGTWRGRGGGTSHQEGLLQSGVGVCYRLILTMCTSMELETDQCAPPLS